MVRARLAAHLQASLAEYAHTGPVQAKKLDRLARLGDRYNLAPIEGGCVMNMVAYALLFLLPAMQPTPKKCDAAEYCQFDFWAGHWTVQNDKGETIGTSHVESIEGGCGLLEHWTDRTGLTGRSINAYRPASRTWTQLWAASWGSTLMLEGRYENDRMVLSGDVTTPAGEVKRQRTTWSRLDNGGVRQLSEWSSDAGRTWTVVFDGRYVPAKPPEP
jgi:hypothetical protein